VRSATGRLVPALDQGSTGSGTSPSRNPGGARGPPFPVSARELLSFIGRGSARPVFPAHPYPRTKAFVRGRSTPRGRRALGVAQTLLACGRATAAAESDCSTRCVLSSSERPVAECSSRRKARAGRRPPRAVLPFLHRRTSGTRRRPASFLRQAGGRSRPGRAIVRSRWLLARPSHGGRVPARMCSSASAAACARVGGATRVSFLRMPGSSCDPRCWRSWSQAAR
jgi:hypothetical protein